MDFLDKNQMFNIFLEESLDSLNELSNYLLVLEKNREDEEAIQNLFRSAHTLKGNSSTVYNTFYDNSSPDEDVRLKHTNHLSLVTHGLESLIMEVRDNGMKLTTAHIDLLFETEQILETLLYLIENEGDEDIDIEPICNKLLQSIEQLEVEGEGASNGISSPPASTEGNGHLFQLDTDVDEDFPHASLSVVYREIEDRYSQVVFSPSRKELEEEVPFTVVSVTISTDESAEEIVDFLQEVTFVTAVHFVSNTAHEETESDAEVPIVNGLPDEEVNESTAANTPPSQRPSNRVVTNTSLRVPINRIDEVLKHVSNLVILRNKLMNITKKINDKQLFDVSDEMSQSIDFIQESVMDIRMTPLDHLFARFPKDVRNIAKEYNKQVQFECIGGETEIDKSLLDELGKPLTHLIRNSIFHGIEEEEERIQAGKSPVGLLRLSAKHEQNMVVLTIEDDGKGIDADAVKRKAIEKGLLTPERADKLTKDQIINLIFHPGLSTAESVTSVAGRGVGMDAVRAVVEDMKGHIEVQSQKGKGTKTIINLPLTLAIIPAMLTKIKGEYFSIPSSQVIEAVEINEEDIRHVANKEVYILREKEIPIIRLNEFFNLSHERMSGEKLKIVILKTGTKTIGATVDEFEGLENIVVKNIGDYLGTTNGISGCNILGDGSISLIVDVNSITNQGKHTSKHID